MRSENETPSICEETDVKVICAVEEAAEEYKDCPAACRKDNSKEDEKEDTVVKSGDLAVTAKAAEGKKALINGTSDLDTLTFKTSEDVTISSITLERYGYSTIDDVVSVQLEDEDGNIIADAKELNNKGQVKLSIKKDYRKVDGTYKATIVLNTRTLPAAGFTATANGSSIGFKVVAAESTAKNLNLDDYDPYTYDLVNYEGSKVEFTSRNSATKDYNWEAGKSYEVAKFRVKAPADASILVKGFTLTDLRANVIDADKYAKDVTVTFDGKEVDGVKWNINKDDELVVSFDEVEIEGKKTASIAVNMSFTEEFDNFGALKGIVQYHIKNITNFNATDKKTGTRISEDATNNLAAILAAGKWTTYQFNGGKVKISGTKLGTVNAAAGSTNIKVAEGEITVTEALRGSATITAGSPAEAAMIDGIRLVINGEEYDAGTPAGAVFTFKGLEIEKSGKVEVRVDLKDAPTANGTITFAGSLNSASFTLKYDESGENVLATQIAGSINVSNIKVQAAKASLENKNTKEVELIKKETNRKTIFDGTYEAKKGAVTLKNFTITSTKAGGAINMTVAPTFYVTVDGEEYDADWSVGACTIAGVATDCAAGDIDDIEVADGKSVNVKVEIEVVPAAGADTTDTFNVKLEGEDEDNNPAGEADDDTVRVKAVDKGSLNVNSSARNTVLLKSDRSLAEFTIKPSKSGDDSVTLDNLTFTLVDGTSTSTLATEKLKVVVDGDTIDEDATNTGNYKPEISIPAEGVTVKVSFKTEIAAAGERTLTLTHVNADPTGAANESRTFKKYYLPALLTITQEKKGDITKYNIDVEKDESSTNVSNLIFYVDAAGGTCTVATNTAPTVSATTCEALNIVTGNLQDTDNSGEATNKEAARSVKGLSYTIGTTPYYISRADYEDYFKVNNGDYLMVYSNK